MASKKKKNKGKNQMDEMNMKENSLDEEKAEEKAENTETVNSSDTENKETVEKAAGEKADAETAEPDAEGKETEETESDAKEEEGKSEGEKEEKDPKQARIEELEDMVKRQLAEFDNFRKRSEKEKSQMFDMGARSVIEKILPVIDNFERGLAQADVNSEDPFVQGMEKIYKQMLTELESIGVSPIEAEGKEFDPNLHNAVMHCEDDTVGDNIVVQELQKGYTYHDTVVRHSMVKVAN